MREALFFYGKLTLIAIGNCILFGLLYYARIRGLASLFSSDMLVFGAPAILALGGYFYIAWSYVPSVYGFVLQLFAASCLLVVLLFSCFWFYRVVWHRKN